MSLISVFIITKNEEDRILLAINSVKKIADEILVVDSGSIDKTRELAISAGAKVIFNEWKGYGQQKIFGENLCKNKWILNIDADETLSEKLLEEINNIFLNKKNRNFAGFKIKIVNKFFLEKKPKKLAYYYNQLRLYNRDFAGFKSSSIHDSVQTKGNVGQLKNIIYHESFRSFSHWIYKINSYSSMQAIEAFNGNKSTSKTMVFLTSFFAFFKAYFIRRYFIYGFEGLIYSALFAFSRFAKSIKIYEIWKK
jgi:glycosyltransferase involved in cell wall biosynthesis